MGGEAEVLPIQTGETMRLHFDQCECIMSPCVRKGEQGIAILALAGTGRRIAEVKTPDGKTEEQVVVTGQRFRVVYLFDALSEVSRRD
jgi:hypothetical protein